jgi:hypothetical protein
LFIRKLGGQLDLLEDHGVVALSALTLTAATRPVSAIPEKPIATAGHLATQYVVVERQASIILDGNSIDPA